MDSFLRAGVFAAPAAITGCARSSLRPIRPSKMVSSSASSVVLKRSASGYITSAASPKLAPPLPSGSNGTTSRVLTSHSAIAARISSASYNPNSWLDTKGALHTLGADKRSDPKELVRGLREHRVTPHIARKVHSAIDRRTTRHSRYAISQIKRKRVEEIFGWLKTVAGLRKTRHRGIARVGWTFAAAAYNLVRMRNLLPVT